MQTDRTAVGAGRKTNNKTLHQPSSAVVPVMVDLSPLPFAVAAQTCTVTHSRKGHGLYEEETKKGGGEQESEHEKER